MKKLITLLTLSVFVLLVQNASAQMGTAGMPGGPGGPGGPGPMAGGPGGPGGPNDHHDDGDKSHCEAMGMIDGSPHVDPPQNILDQVADEYEANCKSGNCFLGEGNYALLEGMGHSRDKVDCFLKEGEEHHRAEHGGPGNHPGGPGPNDHGGPGNHPPCPPDCGPGPMTGGPGGMPPGSMPPGGMPPGGMP